MRSGWLLLGAVALSSISTVSSASPTSDAFAQGSAMGNGAVQGMFSGINPTTEQTNIPGYGGSVSTQSSYFAGGNGNIESPGSAQISDCSNAPPSSNPMANQYCNAVNFLATNPNVRPQITISPNDPLITNSRAISNNAASILQTNGISTTGTSSQCVPVTTTTPAQYTTQMCTTVQGMDMAQCVLGRVVNIATDTNYQCNQTLNSYQAQTCNRTLSVTVTQGATVPATSSTECPQVPGYWLYYIIIGYCVYLPDRIPPSSPINCAYSHGTCINYPEQTILSCPSGYTLSGSVCSPPPTVSTTWNDGCSSLEAAAQ